jgi:uncharacterized lipoprotein YddW (UPF0748 family)
LIRTIDFNRTALERFRAVVEKTIGEGERRLLAGIAVNDVLVYATTFPERFAQFQRNQVTDLVERIYHGVKMRKPRVAVSAAVFANDADAYERRYQAWKTWLKRGTLDVVCPMAYTPDTEVFRQQISVAVGNAAGRQVWSGIGAYRQSVEGTIEKIRVASELVCRDSFSSPTTVRSERQKLTPRVTTSNESETRFGSDELRHACSERAPPC